MRRSRALLIPLLATRLLFAAGSEGSADQGGSAASGQELLTLDQLLSSTEERLGRLRALKELMLELDVLKTQFAEGEQTRAQTGRILATAREISKAVQQEHIDYLLSEAYRQELDFLLSFLDRRAPHAHPPQP
jgi:hypothetical protein